MSIKSKFKTFFFLDDEYDYKEEENIEEEREPVKQVQKQRDQFKNKTLSVCKVCRSLLK